MAENISVLSCRVKICLILMTFCIELLGQATFPFKEKFDGLHPYFSTESIPYATANENWYQAWGWTLLTYLRLYEATGDRDYLVKFVVHSDGLVAKKLPTGIFVTPYFYIGPIWVADMDDDQWLHYSSELAKPMSEYVHLVLSDPELSDIVLPSGLVPSALEGLTHGQYATALGSELLETLSYLASDYWLADYYGLGIMPPNACERHCRAGHCVTCFLDGYWCDCKNVAQMNVQADLAVAIYYLVASGITYNTNLKSKADLITDYFKLRLTTYPGSSGTSKTWFGAPDQDGEAAGYREDVAHGASTIQIPLSSYSLFGDERFSSSDMEEFANTFCWNIWDRTNGVIRNNVYGTDGDVDDEQVSCGHAILSAGMINFYAAAEVLSWMPLHEYDPNDAPNDIYSVLSTQAWKLLEDDETAMLPTGHCVNNTAIFTGVQSYYGLSEVVKAQWQRECTNLTLYNRDLVYDQDFAVKHVLTVDPTPPLGPDGITPITASFADPIITEPRFTVHAGITSQFRAGAAVVWEPGFEAEYGSTVEAVIDPLGCSMSVRMAVTEGAGTTEDRRLRSGERSFPFALSMPGPSEALSPRMGLMPNPTSGFSTLEVAVREAAELRWELLNGLGQRMQGSSPVQLAIGAHALPIDAAGLAPGTYVLRVWLNGKPEQLRLVLTD